MPHDGVHFIKDMREEGWTRSILKLCALGAIPRRSGDRLDTALRSCIQNVHGVATVIRQQHIENGSRVFVCDYRNCIHVLQTCTTDLYSIYGREWVGICMGLRCGGECCSGG